MSETPVEPDELDDPADYQDESEESSGDMPILDDHLPVLEDYSDVEFEEGEVDTESADPDLGTSPGGTVQEPTPGPLEPVSAWSEVDEDGLYEDLVPVDLEPVDEPEEDLTVLLEVDEEDENETSDEGPAWAKYEVWGRNRDDGSEWGLLSTQDYGMDSEAEIANLATGTRMEFRVRLLSSDNVTSEWSEHFFYNLPSDLTPPPAPTAPSAHDNNGFITHSHDGSLVDETPPDMSHRVLYAQQMHPSGDPTGPAGDPMRITEWRGTGAATITTGRYQDSVEHRAWLIAVDTTGNESLRSSYVYFTPTMPVDTERINQELEEINGPNGRLPQLEQSLSMGLDNWLASVATQNQAISTIQQAVNEQASSAQEEYDRLQGEANAALAAAQAASGLAGSKGRVFVQTGAPPTAERLAQNLWIDTTGGANTPKRWSGSAWVAVTDKAATDAATAAANALTAANAAQATANAAQTAAGNAQTTADNAMGAANGKTRIFSSTAAPSGVAADGDLWYRWSSTGANRQLLGIWVRNGTAWNSVGTLAPTLIPLLDAGKISTGQLDAERIGTQSLTAQHVRIQAPEDMIPDPGFETGWWGMSGATVSPSYTRGTVTHGPVVTMTANGSELRTGMYKLIPGASYTLSFNHERGGSQGAANRYRVFLHGLNSTGGFVQTIGESYETYSTTSWQKLDATFTIPEGLPATITQWRVVWRGDAISSPAPSVTIRVANPSMRQRIGGSMVIDGSMGAREINVQDLAADIAKMNQFWAGIGNLLETNTDLLTANNAVIAALSVSELTLHSESLGKRFQVGGIGWNLDRLDASGDWVTTSALGLNGEDQLAMIGDTGNVAASMNSNGEIAGRTVSAQDEIYVGSRPVFGERLLSDPVMEDAENVMDPFPRGVRVFYVRPGVTETTPTGLNPIAYGHVEVDMEPNRVYKLVVAPWNLRDDTKAYSQIFYTTDGSMPTSSSIAGPRIYGRNPLVSGAPTTMDYTWYHRTTDIAPYTFRMLYVVGGTPASEPFRFAGFNMGNNLRLIVEDVGSAVSDSGGGGASLWTSPANPSMTPRTRQVTRSYSYQNHQIFRSNPGSGNMTRQQISNIRGFGSYWSASQLSSLTTAGDHATIFSFADWMAQINGAISLDGVRVRFQPTRFNMSTGSSAYLGFTNNMPTGSGASWTFSTYSDTDVRATNLSAGSRRWVTLPRASLSRFANGSAKFLVIGRPTNEPWMGIGVNLDDLIVSVTTTERY